MIIRKGEPRYGNLLEYKKTALLLFINTQKLFHMPKFDYNNQDPEYRRHQADVLKQNTDLFFGIIGNNDIPDNEPKRSYKGYKLIKDEDSEATTPLLSKQSNNQTTASSTSHSYHSHNSHHSQPQLRK